MSRLGYYDNPTAFELDMDDGESTTSSDQFSPVNRNTAGGEKSELDVSPEHMWLRPDELAELMKHRGEKTKPGVILSERQHDPITALLTHHKLPCIEREPPSYSSIKDAISAGSYRTALNMTLELLGALDQGVDSAGLESVNSPETLQLWTYRVFLLLKISNSNMAAYELEPFGDFDRADLFFNYYHPAKYAGKSGCMVPFQLRLFAAVVPQLEGKHAETLRRLSKLLVRTTRLETESPHGAALWRSRRVQVLESLVSCLLAMKNFHLALKTCAEVVKADSDRAARVTEEMARIALQMGDTTLLKQLQQRGAQLDNPLTDAADIAVREAGLLLAEEKYVEAEAAFSRVLTSNGDLTPLGLNNVVVSQLYQGRLGDAVKRLEGAIFGEPDQYLKPALILTLCTMYELYSSETLQKKLSLLKFVSQHVPDGFDSTCFRL